MNPEKYNTSCQSNFWKTIFRVETEYLAENLKNSKNVVSIGCGPAIIEQALSNNGFNLTGVDISGEILKLAPDNIKKIVSKAEYLPFNYFSFDAAIYIASLQFIQDYKKSIEEAYSILKPGGKIIVILLNPQSAFFKKKLLEPDSYINMIKHQDIETIQYMIAEKFDVVSEYMIGVDDNSIYESQNQDEAILFTIRGTKKKNF